MPMLEDPSTKYKPFTPIHLPNRTWPNKHLTHPPRWLSTDLRDGNQALADPMTSHQKWEYFLMLVKCGFKEIEVAFPSASQIEFDFVRRLIESNAIPDDVAIQVLTPCRPELIKRTVESVRGAKKAIIHLYNATSPCFRNVVFGNTKEETIQLAVDCTKLVRHLTKDTDNATQWQFEYSPETFSATEPDFAIEICEQVKQVWSPSEENPIIFNLPATVELSTPNVYADLIENFSNKISERNMVCISLHPHNDRGTAVAAAELAQMGGAGRVEGVLFGNGERTGNVDLSTLALNLYTQGISPLLDFSDIASIERIVTEATNLPIHPRHPYVGELVFTAFSGSHQDAIKKGFAVQRARKDGIWDMPYLPLDPTDVGRSYEAVIRVNSQSGKGGASWVIQEHLGLQLPRAMQISFGKVVQNLAEKKGRELTYKEITSAFTETYHLEASGEDNLQRFQYFDYTISSIDNSSDTNNNKKLELVIKDNNKKVVLEGVGNGPISCSLNALAKVLGFQLDILEYTEHAIGEGRNTRAASYVECGISDDKNGVNGHSNEVAKAKRGFWGVGIDQDTSVASLKAVLSAANNAIAGISY